MVVQGVPNVCVIHDRPKCISQAMNDIKDDSEDRHRVALWLDV
jgi:hypothetical protein